MKELPTFRGYTVDAEREEFRRIVPGERREFIPFRSPKGQHLLQAWLKCQAAQLAEGLRRALHKRCSPTKEGRR